MFTYLFIRSLIHLPPTLQVSTEEQRQLILDLGSSTEDWLYDEGRSADVSEFKTKHNDIRYWIYICSI